MKDRLEKFIKTEGLTPSRFAEIMGVQPSSISHILGGRNKPSFDFIEKMLQRFPKLNPDWLLLGKGTIYRSYSDGGASVPNAASSSSQPSVIPTPLSLFDLSESSTLPESHKVDCVEQTPRKDDSTSPYLSTPSTDQGADASQPMTQTRHEVDPAIQVGFKSKNRSESVSHPKPGSSVNQLLETPEIERIIIFFKDKTFVSYAPEE